MPESLPINGRLRISATLTILARLMLFAMVGCAAIILVYFVAVPGFRTKSLLSVLFYYIAPAIVLVLSVRALRSSPETQVGTCILLISAMGSLYASEAILRAIPMRVAGFRVSEALADSLCGSLSGRRTGCIAAAGAGLPFDSRSRFEVIRDLEVQGLSAWPSVPGSRLKEGDLEVAGRVVYALSAGIPDELTVLCNESGSWLVYRSDEFGFHNPPGKHRRGEVFVALVGDSYVHGWCVPSEENLAGRLSADFEGVLNLGWQGSGPLAQLGVTREYAAHLRPSFVVWCFFEGNDLRDLERERSIKTLTRYLAPGYSQGLREQGKLLEDALKRWATMKIEEVEDSDRARVSRRNARLRHRSSVRGWLSLKELRSRLAALRRSQPAYPQAAPPEMYAEISQRMRDDVREWGGELLFVYVPSRERVVGVSPVYEFRDRILEVVDSLQIESLDLSDILSGHPDPASLFPFRVQDHFTSEGYGIVAAEIARKIRELSGRRATGIDVEGNTD